MSISKRFRVGRASSIEPVLQLFNVLNDNAVYNYQTRIGGSYGRPTQLLAPRLLRVGVSWSF